MQQTAPAQSVLDAPAMQAARVHVVAAAVRVLVQAAGGGDAGVHARGVHVLLLLIMMLIILGCVLCL
jgi:hypothetical protein